MLNLRLKKKKNLIIGITLAFGALLVLTALAIFKSNSGPAVEKTIYPEARITTTTSQPTFRSHESPEFTLELGRKGEKKLLNQSPIKQVLAETEPEIKTIVSYLGNEPIDELSKRVEIKKGSEGQYTLTIPQPRSFRPGKYQLVVKVKEGRAYQDITQDFTWGVLAINTNKSIYKENEKAEIYFGVVNDMGSTVCDAQLWLEIKTPEGQVSTLSTEEETIKPSGECARDNVTYTPDYSATYQVSNEGAYQMKLTAQTKNGEYQIADFFEVRKEVPFEIERIGPTRINPVSDYDFKIRIKANQDFEGEITEEVPGDYIIIGKGFEGKKEEKEEEVKFLTWSVKLKKGEIKEISYNFDAPDQNPEFHLLGPLKLASSDERSASREIIFEEARKWQIAVDGAGQVILLWDGGVAPTGWTCISDDGGEDFLNKYPRGAATYSGVGGTEVHTHTAIYSSGSDGPSPAGPALDDDVDVTVASATHIHNSIGSQNIGNASNEPLYRSLKVIRSNSASPDTIPSGVIGIFDTTSLPTNWDLYSSQDNYFLKGAGTVGTGGTNTHNHSVSITTGGPNATEGMNEGTDTGESDTHTHTATDNSDMVNHEPPYLEVVYGKTNQDTSVPAGLIAMFDATEPSGWNIVSDSGGDFNGKFIKGNSSGYGGVGGTNVHTHGILTLTLPATSNTTSTADYIPLKVGAPVGHTHANFAVSFNTANHLPPYRNTIFAKKQPEISGIIYSSEGGSAYDCSLNTLTVRVKKNSAGDYTGDCTQSDGTYSVGLDSIAVNDVLTVFLDGEDPVFATTVTRAGSTTGHSGIDLYRDVVIVRHEDSGPITNQNLDQYDSGNDSDIKFTVTLSVTYNLVVLSSTELHVWTSDSFDPGGTVETNDTGGVLHVDDSATAYLDTATSTIGNNIDIDTDATLNVDANSVAKGNITVAGTLTKSTGSPALTLRGTNNISGAGSITFYILAVGDATATSATTFSSSVILTGGALTTYDTSTISTSGTPNVNISAGTGNIGGGSGSITFYNLTIGGTQTLQSNITVSNDLSVSSSLALNDKDIGITNGNFATTGTGQITCTGCTAGTATLSGTGNIGGGGTVTVYNLTVSGAYTLQSGTTTVNNVSVETGDSLALNDQNLIIQGGSLSTAGTGTVTCSGCAAGTTTISGTGNIGGGGTITVYNLTINGTQTLQSDTTVGNDLSVSSSLALNNKNINVTSGNFATTGTGTITCTGCTAGTATLSGSGNIGGGGEVTVYNLTVSGSYTLQTTTTTLNNASVETGDSLALNDQNLNIQGGSLSTVGTGTVTCSGCAAGTVTISGTGNIGGGGTVTAYNLTVNGTQTLQSTTEANNNVSVGDGAELALNSNDLNISGGNLSTTETGTVTCSGCSTGTVTISGTGNIGGGGTVTCYNLTTSGSGTTTLASETTAMNNVSVGDGTTLRTNSNLNVDGGNLTTTNTAIIDYTSGTPTVDIDGSGTLGGGAGGITFYTLNLGVGTTDTTTLSSTIVIDNNLTLETDQTFTVGSNSVTVGSSVANSGGISVASGASYSQAGGTTTVKSSDTGSATIGGAGTTTFNNFTVGVVSDDTSYTFTTAGNITVSSVLTITDGGLGTHTLNGSDDTITLSGISTPFFNNDTFTPSTSIVSYTGNGATNVTATTYYTLSVGTNNSNNIEYTAQGSFSVSNQVNLQSADTGYTNTLNMSTYDLTVGSSSYANSGGISVPIYSAFSQSASGTTTVQSSDGATTPTIGGAGSTTFYNLDIGPSTADNYTYTISTAGDISVSGNLTVQDAGGLDNHTLEVNTNDNAVTVSGSMTIDANATYSASSNTVNPLTIGDDFTNNGTFNHNSGKIIFDNVSNTSTLLYSGAITFGDFSVATAGKPMEFDNNDQTNISGALSIQGTNCTTGRVFLDSDVNDQIWEINATSSVDIDYADVEDSNAITGITTENSTQDNDNNTNWIFTDSVCGIGLSGTAYSDEGSSPLGDNLTVNLRIDGGGTYTDETASGVWEIAGLNLTSTQIVTVYLDDETPEATTVMVSDGTDQTNVHLYQNTLIVRADTGSISNANMATGYDGDDDIKYNVVTNNLTVDPGFELHVWTGDSFDPDGTVTTQGTDNLHVDDSATAYLDTTTSTIAGDIEVDTSATLNIDGDTIVAGGAITVVGAVTTSAGTPTTTIRGTGNIGGGGSITFHNLTIGDATTASTTFTSTVGANGNVSVGDGSSLELGSQDLNISGGALETTGTGTVTCSGCSAGTVTISGTGNIGGGGTVTVYNLTANGTQTLQSGLTANNNISVGNGGELALNDKDVAISGGNLSTSGTGTVTCSGCLTGTVTISGTGNIGGGGTVTVYNLTVNGTQTLQSSTTANNDVSIGSSGELALNDQNLIVGGGDLTTTSIGTITCAGCSAGTTTVNGTAATGIGGGSGGITFYNLIIGGTIPIASAITVSNDLTANGTMSGSSNVTVNGAIAGTGTVNMSGGTVEQRVEVGENFGGTGGNAWTFSTLMFSNSSEVSGYTVTTQSDAGGITCSALLQIGKAGDTQITTLNAGNRTWTLQGTDGTPFDIIGSSSLTASTSTFSYEGNNAVGDTTVQTATYNNLTFNAAETFNPEGTITANGDLTITTGTLAMGVNDLNVGSSGISDSGDISVAGSQNLTQSASGTTTVKTSASGTATIGGAGTLTFYNLTLAPDADGATIYLGSDVSQTITVSNTMTIGNGSNTVTVNADNNDPTIDVNGNFTIAASGVFQASSGGTFEIQGDYSNSGTFTHNDGAVKFNDTAGGKTLSGTMTGGSAFYNLTFDGVSGGWSFEANSATVANNFSIDNGSVTAPSTALTITGNYNNSGTFTHNGGTVTFNASDVDNTLIGTMTDSSSFNNLTFNNGTGSWSFGANAATVANNFEITNANTVTAPSSSLTIGGNFTKSAGSFDANSGTVTFNDNGKTSTLTYNDDVTFYGFTCTTDSKELYFDNVDQTNVTNTFTINGSDCGTMIKLWSDSSGNKYDINVTAVSPSVDYADIKDSNAVTGLTANNSYSSGNVSGWIINGGVCGGVTVSGNAYEDEGSTDWTGCDGLNTNISLVINSGSALTTNCNADTGAYAFYTVTVAADNPVSVFFNTNGGNTDEGVAVTVAADDTSSITLSPRKNITWVKTEGAVSSISNANLDHCDSGSPVDCANVPYLVATSNLTTESGIELHVESSKTYDPGGTVTTNATGGDLHVDDSAIAYLDTLGSSIGRDALVDGSATLNIQANATIGRHLTTAGTSAIVAYTNTPTLTMSGGNIGGGTSPSITFFNLIISGTTTMNSASTTANDLTVNGIMNGSPNVTVNGAIGGTGTVNMSGGTVEQKVDADENFGGTGGNTWTFSTLMFSNSGVTNRTITTQSDAGGITASTLLQIGKAGDSANTILNAGNRTWTLSGTTGTPFDIIGSSSLTASTSTFSYEGDNGGGDTTVQTATYNNLTFNASETFNAEGSITANTDLTVTSGTLAMSSNTLTIKDDLTVTDTLTISGNLGVGSSGVANSGDISVAGTLTQSSSGTTTAKTSASGNATVGGAGALTFYNLTLAPDVDGATIYLGSAGGQTITVSNDLTIGNNSNTVTVNANSDDPTIDVNGGFSTTTNGTFQASNAGTFQVAKNFTDNGSFTHNLGTVTFDTTDTTVFDGSGTPAITFHNFTSATGGKTLQFTESKTFRIEGLFTIIGESGTHITIESTSGTQWLVDHQGTENITYATVQNSGCAGGTTDVTLDPTNSNAGNNGTCWIFQIGKRVKGGVKIKGGVRIK